MKRSMLAIGITGLLVTCTLGCPPSQPLAPRAPSTVRARSVEQEAAGDQRAVSHETKERAKEEEKAADPNVPPPPPPPPPAPQPPPPPR